MGWFPDLRQHPIRAGLCWAILFASLFLLLSLLIGDEVPIERFAVTALLAVPGGIVWAFVTRWWVNRGGNA